MATRNVSLSNLRGIVIIIVVAFHASLAYLVSAPPLAPFNQPPYSWQAFPIVDSHRWIGFDAFCAWQDTNLMALMFLLSGLLTSGSLGRKGPASYIYDRLWRIGAPFLFAIVVLSPISIFPAYLARTTAPSAPDFLQTWISLPSWPTGPQWFLWQLLVLNILAVLAYVAYPNTLGRLHRLAAWLGERPVGFFAILAGMSILAYAPLSLSFSPWSWSALGPFSLQLCRPLLYLVFFATGVCLGSGGIDRGLLASDGPLAKNWWQILIAALLSFGIWAAFTSYALPDWGKAPAWAKFGTSVVFPLACVSGSFFLLSFCLRYAGHVRVHALDSISANAYSIYLVHYVFVVWLQYLLLGTDLIAGAKFAFVFIGALAASWSISSAWSRLMDSRWPVFQKRAAVRVPSRMRV